jgi:hypothetical protein
LSTDFIGCRALEIQHKAHEVAGEEIDGKQSFDFLIDGAGGNGDRFTLRRRFRVQVVCFMTGLRL